MANVNVSIRMDEDVKRAADELFADLGLTLSSAVNIFVRQALREQAIPFVVSLDHPNQETLDAFEEVRRMKADPGSAKSYATFREFMDEMEAELADAV